MPSPVNIRGADPSDGEAIAGLTRELGYDSTPADAAQRLSRLLPDATQAVLVAELGGVITGWIHLAAIASLETEDFVEIRGLVVTAGERGKGIGDALVAAAVEWTRARGVVRLRVRSNVVRTNARRFYERRGFAVTKTQNVFDRRLALPTGEGDPR